jgi:hypothetical protein
MVKSGVVCCRKKLFMGSHGGKNMQVRQSRTGKKKQISSSIGCRLSARLDERTHTEAQNHYVRDLQGLRDGWLQRVLDYEIFEGGDLSCPTTRGKTPSETLVLLFDPLPGLKCSPALKRSR